MVESSGAHKDNSRHNSELKAREIFDNAPIGIFRSTPDGRIISANAALAAMFRYDSPEKMIKSVTDIATQVYADPADREKFKRLLEENGKITNHEARFRCKDGTEIWGSINVSTIPDENGEIIAYQGFIADITKQKQAEEARRKSESFTRTVMDHLPIGIAVNSVDPDVEFSYMNENFPKIYRTTRKALSKPGAFWDVIYEDPVFREKIKNKVVEDVNSGDPRRMTWEDVPFTRDGEGPFYICALNIPLEDKQAMISTVWDVTERKRTEEALRESKENLRATLQSIGDAVISTDMDGLVSAMNPVAESLTGWTREKAIGKPLKKVFRIINEETGNTIESPVDSVLKTGNIIGLANHTLLIARDGREIPIADSGAPIRNDAGEITGVVLVFRDQTEERAARKAL